MRLLLCLAMRPGEIVTIEELLNQVWPDVVVAPDSVYQAVTSLRRLLGDDAKRPTYVATVPRQGYRMIAKAGPWEDSPNVGTDTSEADLREHPAAPTIDDLAAAPSSRINAAFGLVCLSLLLAFLSYRAFARTKTQLPVAARQMSQALAVLPFLDLTKGMQEETFADGITEELIDKLSKVSGLRVPAPTSSFYFKGKRIPVADIGRALRVTFVLDGSVRKSGARVRVAARLVRAENGFVIWTETYDRPFDDIIMVQDDIAGEVTKALRTSIDAQPAPRESE